jgi:hypothetical protein
LPEEGIKPLLIDLIEDEEVSLALALKMGKYFKDKSFKKSGTRKMVDISKQ